MKAIEYLNLRGSVLLTIADKHAKKNGTKICDVLDDAYGELIELGFPEFLKKVGDTGFKFKEFSGVKNYFETLKTGYEKSLVKDTEFKVN